jgi:hypothetical protein
MDELTEWFSIETPPVRKGVYNVSCNGTDQSGQWYSYWDGLRFNYYSYQNEAYEDYLNHGLGAGPATQSWRGLASPPAAQEEGEGK